MSDRTEELLEALVNAQQRCATYQAIIATVVTIVFTLSLVSGVVTAILIITAK